MMANGKELSFTNIKFWMNSVDLWLDGQMNEGNLNEKCG